MLEEPHTAHRLHYLVFIQGYFLPAANAAWAYVPTDIPATALVAGVVAPVVGANLVTHISI